MSCGCQTCRTPVRRSVFTGNIVPRGCRNGGRENPLHPFTYASTLGADAATPDTGRVLKIAAGVALAIWALSGVFYTPKRST